MSNTTKRFNYNVIKFPFDPHVEIVLDQWSTDNGGIPVISPKLVTEGEIDLYIQQLKADLDAVGKKANAALLQAKNETNMVEIQTGTLPQIPSSGRETYLAHP